VLRCGRTNSIRACGLGSLTMAAPEWSRRASVAPRALASVVVPQPGARPTTATTGRACTAAGEGGTTAAPLSRSGVLGAVAPRSRNVDCVSGGAGSTSHSPTRASRLTSRSPARRSRGPRNRRPSTASAEGGRRATRTADPPTTATVIPARDQPGNRRTRRRPRVSPTRQSQRARLRGIARKHCRVPDRQQLEHHEREQHQRRHRSRHLHAGLPSLVHSPAVADTRTGLCHRGPRAEPPHAPAPARRRAPPQRRRRHAPRRRPPVGAHSHRRAPARAACAATQAVCPASTSSQAITHASTSAGTIATNSTVACPRSQLNRIARTGSRVRRDGSRPECYGSATRA